MPFKLGVHLITHWFDLEEGQYIQGLVAHYNDEKRVYVVTVEPAPLTRQIHDRGPRVIGQ